MSKAGKSSRRSFLKGASVAAAGAGAALVPTSPTQAPPTQAPPPPPTIQYVAVPIRTQAPPLCVGCETLVATVPAREPRFCVQCRVFSYRKAVKDGLIEPSPGARYRQSLFPFNTPEAIDRHAKCYKDQKLTQECVDNEIASTNTYPYHTHSDHNPHEYAGAGPTTAKDYY